MSTSTTGNILTCDLLFGACCHIAKGLLSANIAPLCTALRLIALPKGNRDVRPIAIGETLRRLIEVRSSNLLCSLSTWGNYRTPGGSEMLVHHIQMLLELDSELRILKQIYRMPSIVSQDNNF